MQSQKEGIKTMKSDNQTTHAFRHFLFSATIVALFLISPSVQAEEVTYALSVEFSGDTAPEGTAPWLIATLDDGNTPGSVDLTIETTGLMDNEYVFEMLFNLDPALDPDLLAFSLPTKIGEFWDPTINTGANLFKADGDGFYDIQIDFEATDGPQRKFGVGDTVAYNITAPMLTAASFDFLSLEGGGAGSFPTVAHVGGIGPSDDDSGWITIPEPTALSLLALGGLAIMRRKKR